MLSVRLLMRIEIVVLILGILFIAALLERLVFSDTLKFLVYKVVICN